MATEDLGKTHNLMDAITIGDVVNQMPVKMKNRLCLLLGVMLDESTTISTVDACLVHLVGPLIKGGKDNDVYIKTIAYVVKEALHENCSDERQDVLLQSELVRAVVYMIKV